MGQIAANKVLDQNKTFVRISSRGIFFLATLALILIGWPQSEFHTSTALAAQGNADGPGVEASLPTLRSFAKSVENGSAGSLVGVYVTGVLAFPVLQQPAGNPGFVTTQLEAVTQFSLAAQYNTMGLLAHNYLAGRQFFGLDRDQEVVLVFGDGSLQYYRISEVGRYRALSPNSPYSSFENLDDGTYLGVVELFNQMYGQGNKLVFQTCIEAYGNLSWGRLFVTAEPVEKPDRISYKFRPQVLRLD